jgi:hypothetical protein
MVPAQTLSLSNDMTWENNNSMHPLALALDEMWCSSGADVTEQG